jgi:hypothetical protein
MLWDYGTHPVWLSKSQRLFKTKATEQQNATNIFIMIIGKKLLSTVSLPVA